MLNLHVVIASTRPNRGGLPVANWFLDQARAHGQFNIELVDLLALNLPHLDEPNHPRLRQYQHDHTRAWSATVDRADAFVFVTPEYNYSAPPALINALDYLFHEWTYKPVGFVSYGGLSGGTRSVQVTKQIVTTLNMMPISEAVALPFYTTHLDNDTGVFAPGEKAEKSAAHMLTELAKWAGALQVLRHK